jgi:hypothetical protein
MNRRHFSALALVMGAALAIESTVTAQKGKMPADVPGMFSMRSPSYPPTFVDDRVTGDPLGDYAGDGYGTRVILNGNREFRAELFGPRYVRLDFPGAIPGTACTSGCFRLFGGFVVPTANTHPPEGPWRVVMQTNVVTSGNVEIANGLMSLVTNGPAGYARFFVSFKDPDGRDFHWSVLYNPAEYPGSNLARVVRTSPCSWTVYADADGSGVGARAGLRAWQVKKGRSGNSDEGLFSMPFGINFNASGCAP